MQDFGTGGFKTARTVLAADLRKKGQGFNAKEYTSGSMFPDSQSVFNGGRHGGARGGASSGAMGGVSSGARPVLSGLRKPPGAQPQGTFVGVSDIQELQELHEFFPQDIVQQIYPPSLHAYMLTSEFGFAKVPSSCMLHSRWRKRSLCAAVCEEGNGWADWRGAAGAFVQEDYRHAGRYLL